MPAATLSTNLLLSFEPSAALTVQCLGDIGWVGDERLAFRMRLQDMGEQPLIGHAVEALLGRHRLPEERLHRGPFELPGKNPVLVEQEVEEEGDEAEAELDEEAEEIEAELDEAEEELREETQN